jgi:hypothetical protein
MACPNFKMGKKNGLGPLGINGNLNSPQVDKVLALKLSKNVAI